MTKTEVKLIGREVLQSIAFDYVDGHITKAAALLLDEQARDIFAKHGVMLDD